jgi:phospholipid-translocating ATPase
LREDEFSSFKQQFDTLEKQKSENLISRNAYKKKFNELSERLENQLILTGVSAIEDKLQDGVPETIQRLKEADIKIVMITGDKLETAENIGYLSNFISQNSKVFRLR